jgi:tryptophan-rich sensory protein
MIAFRRLDRLSSWAFPPYLAWVTFAGALNLAIYQIN